MNTATPIYFQAVPPGAIPAGSMVAAVPVIPPGYRYPQPQPEVQVGIPSGDTTATRTDALQSKLSIGDTITNLAINTNTVGKVLGKAAGPLGIAASGAFGTATAVVQAGSERAKLLEEYRPIVARQLGIAPAQVTEASLYVAAEKFAENKALKQALDKTDTEEGKSPVKGLLSTGAAIVGGGLSGALGIVSGPGALVTGIAGSMAASTVAEKAFDAVAGSDGAPMVLDIVKQMEEKLKSGQQPVGGQDIFALHVALDKGLAQQVEERMGGAFHTLDMSAQKRCMEKYHGGLCHFCCYVADAVNQGWAKPGDFRSGEVLNALKSSFDRALPASAAFQPTCQVMTQGALVSPLMPHVATQVPMPVLPVYGAHTQQYLQQQTLGVPVNPQVS